ncbi:S1 family peptidase [Microbispora sp. ATCC PTA-5024]|uniref:S1 family peptidase n=1 Tax=Microbispora sp. ATCC PTA-5024 TaxID=316330 RepID=UPI0003DDB52B|nr:S1 family peptidase [Microbispora sp. ATCC PTA-5024]ETK33613.1 hypothetical protein MPTA5024_23540 [Microbispora sp. ATCC PTA-5024]
MLPRRAATAACALAVGVTTLLAAPAMAAPGDASGPSGAQAASSALKPPPAMLEAMQRDLGLSAAQAEARVANESRASATETKLRKRLDASFAGSWVSGPTSSTLVVATTDAGRSADIAAQGATPQVVGRSLAALTAAKDALDRASAKAPSSTPIWYVDVRSNSVVVQSSQPAEAEAFVKASGADPAAVRVVQSSEQPRPLYDVRGGDAYYIAGQARCSIGFSVTKGSTNGFVSAGHCATVGSSLTGYNQVSMGSFQGYSFPGNDYSWAAVNSNWTAQPWVNNGSGGNVTVSGSTVAVEGASICRSGSTTGWHCGTVQQRNTSVTYQEGTVNEVTRTNVCAEPGDSGGSFISGSQAQGVTSGGSGNCSVGGTTYFQPVNEILSAYGLTLVTSGGGNPPPTGCSGYQQTYTGSLTSGGNAYQPNNSYYQSTVSGTHKACLDGPDGTDFDLYLQKWNGSSWVNVASGTTANPDETVTYSGTAGYYRYRVNAYSGSGSYTLGITKP